jgi:hypothetical protein
MPVALVGAWEKITQKDIILLVVRGTKTFCLTPLSNNEADTAAVEQTVVPDGRILRKAKITLQNVSRPNSRYNIYYAATVG